MSNLPHGHSAADGHLVTLGAYIQHGLPKVSDVFFAFDYTGIRLKGLGIVGKKVCQGFGISLLIGGNNFLPHSLDLICDVHGLARSGGCAGFGFSLVFRFRSICIRLRKGVLGLLGGVYRLGIGFFVYNFVCYGLPNLETLKQTAESGQEQTA